MKSDRWVQRKIEKLNEEWCKQKTNHCRLGVIKVNAKIEILREVLA